MTNTSPIVLLEGLFTTNESGDDLFVQSDRGRSSVSEHLVPMLGQQVRLAAHHLPSNPINPARWGGGSCEHQGGICPFGHHQDPTRMYSFAGEGVLKRSHHGKWLLSTFEGQLLVPQLDDLCGHWGRVACVSVTAVERMRDVVAKSGLDANLGVRASELKDLLSRLRSAQ